MKVIIVKCSKDYYCYRDSIGEMFEVMGIGDKYYYSIASGQWKGYVVLKSDCEIVEKESHMDTSGIVLTESDFNIYKTDVQNNRSIKTEFDPINKPAHYADSKIKTIDFIEDKKLNYHLGNVVKYVTRAKKDPNKMIEDLKKAAWYLNREIERQEKL